LRCLLLFLCAGFLRCMAFFAFLALPQPVMAIFVLLLVL